MDPQRGLTRTTQTTYTVQRGPAQELPGQGRNNALRDNASTLDSFGVSLVNKPTLVQPTTITKTVTTTVTNSPVPQPVMHVTQQIPLSQQGRGVVIVQNNNRPNPNVPLSRQNNHNGNGRF